MAKKGNLIGAWSFLIGVILAVIIGLMNLSVTEGTLPLILVVLGILIGLLNVGGKEMTAFLLAGVSLVIVSALGGQTIGMVPYVGNIIKALIVLFVPATIVVALKSVFVMAKA